MRDDLITLLDSLNNDSKGRLLSADISEYVDKIQRFATIVTISKKAEIKAFIAYYENDKKEELAYLTMIAVCKESWQLGYGKNLLECSIKALTNRGFKKYKLEVKEDNLKAIQLYKDYGFKILSLEQGMFSMEKEL